MSFVLGGRSIGAVLARSQGAAASNGLLTGLVAYWTLDEASGNAIDAHANGLTLTANNAPGNAAGQVYGTARSFNGSSQYFSRASEAALQTGDIDFAIAAWVFLTAKPTAAMRIISKRSGSTTNDYDLYWDNATDKFTVGIGSAAGSAIVIHTATPNLNTWHFVTAWHDATNNLLWINVDAGTPVSQATGAATPAASTAPLELGRLNQLSARWWTGRIGPVAMWKNRTLSAADRTLLWNGGAGLAYSGFS